MLATTITWNRTADLLPNVNESVLAVWGPKHDRTVGEAHMRYTGKWRSQDGVPLERVTHWAPMPTAPEE